MSVRTSNTKRTTLSAETLARTRHRFERSKEHWTHRPCSEIKYQQKNHWGEVLNFSFLKIIRRLLLLPGYHTTLHHITGSQTTHYRSTSSQSRQHFSRFGQQDLYLPPMIENLLIYFFQYRPFVRGVAGRLGVPIWDIIC